MSPAGVSSHAMSPKTRDVLSQIGDYLKELGYSKSFKALKSEGKENGIDVDVEGWKRLAQSTTGDSKATVKLLDLWRAAKVSTGYPTLDAAADNYSDDSDDAEEETNRDALIDDEAEETSDDSSDEDSDSDSARAGQKRKRVLTPDASSESDSGSSSGSKDAIDESSDNSSESSSDSSSSDSESPARKRVKTSTTKEHDVDSSSSSDSESSSSGDSDSSSSSESDRNDADGDGDDSSDASSDSDSDSSSSSSPSPPPTKKSMKSQKAKAPKVPAPLLSTERTGSATSSSATLQPDSPVKKANEISEEAIDTLVLAKGNGAKELPATQGNIKKLKKEGVPFSRIPADQKVDPRFASNAYVSYDYADRAHRDLIVTKGKGFTKEKNKKKRGSYRGGTIDLTPKAIKFDD